MSPTFPPRRTTTRSASVSGPCSWGLLTGRGSENVPGPYPNEVRGANRLIGAEKLEISRRSRHIGSTDTAPLTETARRFRAETITPTSRPRQAQNPAETRPNGHLDLTPPRLHRREHPLPSRPQDSRHRPRQPCRGKGEDITIRSWPAPRSSSTSASPPRTGPSQGQVRAKWPAT
jgi:hypothetical protein